MGALLSAQTTPPLVATSTRPAALFLIARLLTLTVPLQWAIVAGAFLSLAAFVVVSASGGELQLLSRDGDDWIATTELPKELTSDAPVFVRYRGPTSTSVRWRRSPARFPAELGKYVDRLAAARSGLVLRGAPGGAPIRSQLGSTATPTTA